MSEHEDRLDTLLKDNPILPDREFSDMIDRTSHGILLKSHRSRGTAALHLSGAAASVLILCTICVPSVRAEVLTWFGKLSPEEYVAISPEERETDPALEEMITPSEEHSTDLAVTEVGPASAVIPGLDSSFACTLGDTLYDGESLYVTLQLKGLSGLFLLEQDTGGTLTRQSVPKELVAYYFDDAGPEQAYLTGEKVMYVFPDSWCSVTFPDGYTTRGLLELNAFSGPIADYIISLREEGLSDRKDLINERNLAFLQEHDITAYCSFDIRYLYDAASLAAMANEDGLVPLQVSFQSVLDNTGREAPTKVLMANLGTARFDPAGYLKAAEAAAPASSAPPA